MLTCEVVSYRADILSNSFSYYSIDSFAILPVSNVLPCVKGPKVNNLDSGIAECGKLGCVIIYFSPETLSSVFPLLHGND